MAVELGRKIFGSLKNSTVLLIGAGEMAELSARHLLNAGATRADRQPDACLRAETRGGFWRSGNDYNNLAHYLAEADIVICLDGCRQ
jgi:glutamyl-tRNA reductase